LDRLLTRVIDDVKTNPNFIDDQISLQSPKRLTS
jgi:hypothetical protein